MDAISKSRDEVIDVIGRPCPGSLMRSASIGTPGTYRLARRHAELYSVQICSQGAWGNILLYDETGNDMFFMPSAFTGSFVIMGHADQGLYLKLFSRDIFAPQVTINWREPDANQV